MWVLFLFAVLHSQGDPSRQARELVEKLRSDRIEEREEAERGLRVLGKPAIPELEKAAKDGEVEVARRAQHLLRVISIMEGLPPALLKAMPGIVDRLASGEPRACTEAFLALAEPRDASIRAEDLEAIVVPALKGARRDGNPPSEASRVLRAAERWSLRSATREIAMLLLDSEVDSSAADALKNLDATDAIPDLIPMLRNPQQSVRFKVVEVLGDLGAKQAIPGIRRLLEDPDDGVRERAVEALGILGAKEAIGDLVPLLKPGRLNRRGAVARALARLGAKEAVPDLLLALDQGTPESRAAAMEALAGLGAREVVRRLVRGLADDDASVRSTAVRLLGNLEARDAIPEIARHLEDSQSQVRIWTVATLAELGAREHLGGIADRLADKESYVRAAAARAVARLRAREEIPRLQKLLEDPDGPVRGAAAEALVALGAPDLTPRLVKLLDGGDWISQSCALRALADLEAKEAAPSIARLLGSGQASVRSRAIGVLVRLGGREYAGEIRKLLSDPNYLVRIQAAESLGSLGSTEGVPLILREARDRRWPVQEAGGSLFIAKSPRALNALRSPGMWDRLGRMELPEQLEGTRKSLVERLAQEAGLQVEWSPGVNWEEDAWMGGQVQLKIYSKRQTFLGQLVMLLQGRSTANKAARYEVIVEPDALRVMPYHDALKFWESWWADHPKK